MPTYICIIEFELCLYLYIDHMMCTAYRRDSKKHAGNICYVPLQSCGAADGNHLGPVFLYHISQPTGKLFHLLIHVSIGGVYKCIL